MTSLPDNLGDPASYLVLEKGTPVLSSDGERVGRVEEVLADEGEDVFDGLLVDTGILGLERRYVAADRVDEIYERAVVLRGGGGVAEDLPPRDEAAGAP